MSLPRPPHAFIFDLDGVVIDSEPLHEQALRSACAAWDLDVSDALFDEFRGRTDRAIAVHLAEQAPATVDAEALLAAKHEAYDALLDELTLIPGVTDFIEMLDARGLPLALVTSATQHDQRRTFERFGLHGHFPIVVTADDVEQTKPHPQPYRRATDQLGIAASACVVVEDSARGVESARRAGCTVVGLCSSFPAETLRDAGAHLTVERYDALTTHVLSVLGDRS